MVPARRLVALLAIGLTAVLLPSIPASAGHDLPDLDQIDPVRFDYDDAIVERQLITARDLTTTLGLDIIRPDTPEPVPTIFLQSPYYNTVGRGYRAERKTPWGSPNTTPSPQTPFPEWYDEHFVPRGYAVVMQDQRGTRNSSGCQVYGGPEEGNDAVDVIEWIVEQPWSNGAVGMTGGSYDGTVATAAAAQAPEGLKAIIPIRAIDRWYDYHFFNGLQSSQHLLTPWNFTTITPVTDHQSSWEEDPLVGLHVIERKACAASLGALVSAQYSTPYQDATSPFWAGRDFLKDAGRIEAATFIIHGLEDTNVKTTNAGHLWEALPEGTPKKIWWLRGGHDDPANPGLTFPLADRFKEWTHRWYAQFLKGLDAGARDAPPVSVQGEDGAWADGLEWPAPGSDRTYYLSPGGLSETPGSGTLTYTDGTPATGGSTVTLTTGPLTEDLRISGQAFLSLEYSLSNGGDTTFAYRLDDVGPSGAREIASAYARGAYREELEPRGPSSPTLPAPHLPDEQTAIAFPFVHHDYVVPAGHHLRLTIDADDGRTQGGGNGSTVTLHLGDGTRLVVPDSASRQAEHLRALCAFHPDDDQCT
jgi:X-Pro dipeptidyl-peptidase